MNKRGREKKIRVKEEKKKKKIRGRKKGRKIGHGLFCNVRMHQNVYMEDRVVTGVIWEDTEHWGRKSQAVSGT